MKDPQTNRETEVISQCNALSAQITQLHEATKILSSRLVPVLREANSVSGIEPEKSAPLPMLCPLADRIRDAAQSIYNANQDLQSLIEHLEV